VAAGDNQLQIADMKKSVQALLKAINAHEVGEVVPDGWYSSDDIAQASGLFRSSVQKKITEGVRAGKIERRKFRVAGATHPVMHYRQIEGGKKQKNS
jgi:predicted transcriptional regulator